MQPHGMGAGRGGGTKAGLARVAAAATLAAGWLLWAGTSTASASSVLYAAVSASGVADCSDVADACDLSTALADVAPGGTIQLVTPGDTARYVGNWRITTAGTSDAQPVTIEPEPGLGTAPILDGNGPEAPSGQSCSTPACNGPILTVFSGTFATVTGVAFDDGATVGGGGAIDSNGSLTVAGATFYHNFAQLVGGAIFSGVSSGTASLTVTDSTFDTNLGGTDGGAIFNGNGSTATVAGSTFTGNFTDSGNGGAIDTGDNSFSGLGRNAGPVTVSGSTFTGNTAGRGGSFGNGGAIDSGTGSPTGPGAVTVSASTFSGNSATTDGGAIDSGDNNGGGAVSVSASTFSGNDAANGPAIDGGDHGGGGTVSVAADVFSGSCQQGGGTWADEGYNAGTDLSCFAAPPASGDINAGSASALALGSLADNGGPTQTMLPGPGAAIGVIPDQTAVTLGGDQVQLCPATDQRGTPSTTGIPCDAGAIQTSSAASSLSLAESTTSTDYSAAGDTIPYSYLVSNTGTTMLSGVGVSASTAPTVSCPSALLAPGAGETCTGSYTVTHQDLVNGSVTDTATAAATAPVAGTVTSGESSVTVDYAPPPPVFTAAQPPLSVPYPGPYGYNFGASSIPAPAYGLTGAPGWLSIDPGSGQLTGTPPAGVTSFSYAVTATDPGGTATAGPFTVTVTWPAIVVGVPQPAAYSAEGFYVGVNGNRWTLKVTHPGTAKVSFAGAVTINAGHFTNVTPIALRAGDGVSVNNRTLTFTCTDKGGVKGFQFSMPGKDTTITFTLQINGQLAPAGQIYLGSAATPAATSPLTLTR